MSSVPLFQREYSGSFCHSERAMRPIQIPSSMRFGAAPSSLSMTRGRHSNIQRATLPHCEPINSIDNATEIATIRFTARLRRVRRVGRSLEHHGESA